MSDDDYIITSDDDDHMSVGNFDNDFDADASIMTIEKWINPLWKDKSIATDMTSTT